MEKFKVKIRKRLIWMFVITLCLAATSVVLQINKDNMPLMHDYIRDFHTGAFIGIMLFLAVFMSRNTAALFNDKVLKKLYILEHDERNKMILQKTGAMGMSICYIGLAFAAVVAGFFNEVVFFTLLGATFFTAFVKGIFKIYYSRKF